MGFAGDFVRKAARDAIIKQMQNLFAVTPAPSPIVSIGCINDDDPTKITLPDGSVYNVIIQGTVCGKCGPVTRMNSTTYLMVGADIKIKQADGGSKGYILSGAYLNGSLKGSIITSPFFIYSTAWPTFTVFDVQNTSNYFEVPSDAFNSVFQTYFHPNNPLSTGFDGTFWAQFSPGMTDLAIIRINNINDNVLTSGITSGNGVSPHHDIAWMILNGIGFDTKNNLLTYKSIGDGATTINYQGQYATVAEFPPHNGHLLSYNIGNTQFFQPYCWWDTAGTFHFDLLGNWNSQIGVFDTNNTETIGNINGIAIVAYAESFQLTTTDLGWVTPYSDSGTVFSVQRTFASVNQSIPGDVVNDVGTGTPAFRLATADEANFEQGITDSLSSNAGKWYWTQPYGTRKTLLPITPPVIFDTTTTYPVDSLWTDIFSASDAALKVTGTGTFCSYRDKKGTVVAGVRPLTFTLTNYSWDTESKKAVKGTEIAGNELHTHSSSNALVSGDVGTVLDWTVK